LIASLRHSLAEGRLEIRRELPELCKPLRRFIRPELPECGNAQDADQEIPVTCLLGKQRSLRPISSAVSVECENQDRITRNDID